MDLASELAVGDSGGLEVLGVSASGDSDLGRYTNITHHWCHYCLYDIKHTSTLMYVLLRVFRNSIR